MAIFIDQLNRSVNLPSVPQKIISLVPSQTELLYDLGLDSEVIAITKFCVHPSGWFKEKTKIGGTKNINIEKIKSLNPDLIIANKEENLRAQIEMLTEDFPVWISDISNVNGAIKMISMISEIINCNDRGNNIISKIKSGIETMPDQKKPISYAYLIWKNPLMVAGYDTFISDMLSHAGFKNIISKSRYPEIRFDELSELSPDVIFLSSEPYPFKEKHIEEFKSQFKKNNIFIVDGEMISWYGSRMIKGSEYLKDIRRKIVTTLVN